MDRIFMLAGQSNMAGAGLVEQIPEPFRTPPGNVRLYEDGDWRDLTWRERFGPEFGFAHAVAPRFPADTIVLCKVAAGGANLYYDWNPDGVSQGPEDTYRGPMYPPFLEAARVCAEASNRGGRQYEYSGMLWMQGERDSVFEFMAHAYRENLTAFISTVRSDLRAPRLPFLIAQIAPRIYDFGPGTFRHAWRRVVQDAQAAVAQEVSHTAFIETMDLPQSDNLHFDTAGQILLGRRLAESWTRMTSPDRLKSTGVD